MSRRQTKEPPTIDILSAGVYRSGLLFRPPLAGGGHCWTRCCDPTERAPGLWRCLSCMALATDWQLAERFVDRPCRGLAAALPPAQQELLRG
jgi:hypothetical protein